MRRRQKRQAEDLVKLLHQAHLAIKKMMEIGNAAVIMNLLEQCQKAAIHLGELIEQTEGEDFVTVHMLEEYCELVYKVYGEIEQNPPANAAKIYQTMQKHLADIDDSIQHDIKVYYEAVFLPYRATVWSAMESVWEAAQDDPQCTAYVIPVPYYYKNIDGSFQEMQYDGGDYPDYVPVTKYDEFDFGQHQPDMIFIQSPYDEYNPAVSVHPFFYSVNLKKVTEKLIYIPYFTLDEITMDDERAKKNIVNFIRMPGVVNADKVIVQSEAMRQTYIDFLSGEAGENTRKMWEEKISGIGSPKLDKEKRTGLTSLDIPTEWEDTIKKENGDYKKVFLYGTSISVLLQYGEQYLEKMRHVFYSFYDKRNEVAIWWYPQPISMIRENLLPLHKELYLKYEKLVEEYKKGKWGIYDETTKEERAAKFCDAYYGDGGNMIRLFIRQRKPVLLQVVK